MSRKTDEYFMREAVALAQKGYGRTRTNPLVGAVVVKNNKIIGYGYHARFGAAHAEVTALGRAGTRVRGATLYVSLEPCSTYGKTPPCTDAIIAAGIKRVVIAAVDPNPIHRRKGIRILRQRNIQTTVGILRKEAEEINTFFRTVIQKQRPYVILKLAQSIDGKIASRTGDSQWITSQASRKTVHDLRKNVDAVLVGTNTVRIDDPLLTVRHVRSDSHPARIILDKKGVLSLTKNVFKNARKETVIVCIAEGLSRVKADRYIRKGIHVVRLPLRNGKLNLALLFNRLLQFDIGTVLVEGGARLAAAVFEEKLVDKVFFFVAPIIIGGEGALGSVAGRGVEKIIDAIKIKRLSCEEKGRDFLITGFPEY